MDKPQEPENTYIELVIDDAVYKTRTNRMHSQRKPYVTPDPGLVTSFMPGNIQELFVAVGQEVEEGTRLCILEAMKMKNVIIAPVKGVVRAINVKIGDMVPKNHVLVELGVAQKISR